MSFEDNEKQCAQAVRNCTARALASMPTKKIAKFLAKFGAAEKGGNNPQIIFLFIIIKL